MNTASFEDIKCIYINRYSQCKGKVLASDLGDFTNKVTTAIMNALNGTDIGRDLVNDLREELLKKNPDMLPEEWSDAKAKLMTFLFYLIMEECPIMKHELAIHTYDAMRKEV